MQSIYPQQVNHTTDYNWMLR